MRCGEENWLKVFGGEEQRKITRVPTQVPDKMVGLQSTVNGAVLGAW